jgi:hypothetical protein
MLISILTRYRFVRASAVHFRSGGRLKAGAIVIFISYRRDDESAHAARVRDHLCNAFGSAHVFMDVDNLLAGQRFDRELAKALEKSEVFLVIIGPRWLELLKARLIDHQVDYVRIEISSALKRGISVVPLLTNGAILPKAEELPEDIREMVLYQKLEIRHERFRSDMDDLINQMRLLNPSLISMKEQDKPMSAASTPHPPLTGERLIYVLIATGLLVVILFFGGMFRHFEIVWWNFSGDRLVDSMITGFAVGAGVCAALDRLLFLRSRVRAREIKGELELSNKLKDRLGASMIVRTPGVDAIWVRKFFLYHAGGAYFIVPRLSQVEFNENESEHKAIAMNQLAGVFSDLRLIRPMGKKELEEAGKEEARANLADLNAYKEAFREQEKKEGRPVRELREDEKRRIRNHGLFSNAERMLVMAGWKEQASSAPEIFRLVDPEYMRIIFDALEAAFAGRNK